MADLKFVDQHNMVACLEKTEENAEFHQIVDFLSLCSITYALIVSPTIYAFYIEQFWNTATSKTVNSVKQIHAIVDGKAVVIELISEKCSSSLMMRMFTKSTAWNEFLTNLASAVICLANGQKFNFSKLIFDGMLRNLDPKRFLMYLRFLQLFSNNQLKDLPEPFNDTYEIPKHSKKVFSNMARKSKKFSRKFTPLFDSMLVQNQAPESEGSTIPPEPQPIPSTSQPNASEPQTESLQTETPPTVSHELETEAHNEKILLSPSTYQRKQRKTQKHRRSKQVTALPQTSVPLDHRADEDVHKEGVTTQAPRYHIGGVDAQTRPETASKMSRDPPLSEVNTSGRGEDNMEYHDDLTDFVPPTPHDSPFSGGNIPGSDEGRMELIQELMETCTSLIKRVLALEEAKTAQDRVITRLKLRVKRLEKKRQARTPQPMKRKLFKGSVETSTDKKVIVEYKGSGEKGGSTADQFSTARPEVSAASVPVNVSAATPSTPPIITTIFDDEDITIAYTLVKMRSEKAKENEKGIVLIDEEKPPRLNRSTTTLQPLLTIDPKDKGKGVMVEEEPEKPVKVKRRDQGIDADHELAVRLTHEEQEKYTIEERARLLAEFFERRKKILAAKRAEAIKNKPPTRTQVRNRMITYLKHMGKYTPKKLKHKNFEEVQKLCERDKKWIDDFKPIDDDSQQQAESTKKRPRADFEKESSKKQTLEEDNDAEKEELRDSMDVVPRDDVESLATKYSIVDWKTHILNENMMYDIC
ncbi:hypothetical protein Tco_0852994 [Tanacetum coccineum]